MTRLLLIWLAAILAASPALALYNSTVTNFTIDSGDYVIDSDASRAGPSYERDLIKTSANLTFTSTGVGASLVSYRCD